MIRVDKLAKLIGRKGKCVTSQLTSIGYLEFAMKMQWVFPAFSTRVYNANLTNTKTQALVWLKYNYSFFHLR